jgi:hypothetical protein
MKIETDYRQWNLTEGNNFRMEVTQTSIEVDRGGYLGKAEVFGSIVKLNEVETVLTITDREHPNCESSLSQILLEHACQMKLGTFGHVTAPHNTDADRFCVPLRRLGVDSNLASVCDYVQIPMFMKGTKGQEIQLWSFRRFEDEYVYEVFRKWDRYYTTKVVRERDTYSHPFRDEVLDKSVSKRREEVEYTSTSAEPFDFDKEIARLFD